MDSVRDMLALWPGAVAQYEFTLPHPTQNGNIMRVKLLRGHGRRTDYVGLQFKAFNTLFSDTTYETRVHTGIAQRDLFGVIERFTAMFVESERINEILKAIPKAQVFTMRAFFDGLRETDLKVEVMMEVTARHGGRTQRGTDRNIAFGATRELIVATVGAIVEHLPAADRRLEAARIALLATEQPICSDII